MDATAGKKSDGVRHEGDGDTHGWLQVDSGFESLLNAGNLQPRFRDRLQVPCDTSGRKGCMPGLYGYTIKLPSVGSHVRIVGTYVQDTFHAKWME